MSESGASSGVDDWWEAGKPDRAQSSEADGNRPGEKDVPPGIHLAGQSTFNSMPPTSGQQRFYDLITPTVFLLFSVLALALDQSLIRHWTSRGAAFAVSAIAALAIYGLVRTPYVAVLAGDDALVFKSLTSTTRTCLANIQRVRYARGARGGGSWVFYFDRTRKSLGNGGGKALARLVIARNPSLKDPQ